MKKSPLHTDVETWIRYNNSITQEKPLMSKEMLFLCDVYDAWLIKNKLPHRCASEILYGADTMDKLTANQSYWLESFISTWDVIAQNT